MKKLLAFTLLSSLFICGAFADDFDDLFMDDGIDEMTVTSDVRTDEVNHGSLFETGSIKVGGTFSTSLSTLTTLWADDDTSFGDHVKDTTLLPTVSAFLTVDARPTQTLRMYTKFGLAYPFSSSLYSTAETTAKQFMDQYYYSTTVSNTFTDYLKVKELFTDFSVADRAFFRFGLHTVTWGTGYFYSPVSDMINTSSINPEDTSAQVDGALNLRTQITFPGTQNCLWFYVIPGDPFSNYSNNTYLKETAFAGKADLVFGNWELGAGAFYKFDSAPKAMLTATGSLKKMSMFGEFVYQYGGNSEWSANKEWKDKTSIFRATAGVSYYWKTPSITLAAQYYYDGNKIDKTVNVENIMVVPDYYQGHNIAFTANFGRVFGTTDFTINLFGMANFDNEGVYVNPMAVSAIKQAYPNVDVDSLQNLPTVIFSAMLNYSPTNEIKVGMGPYMTMKAFDKPPVVSLKLNFTLGGGKF